jgi:hypothetical protein
MGEADGLGVGLSLGDEVGLALALILGRIEGFCVGFADAVGDGDGSFAWLEAQPAISIHTHEMMHITRKFRFGFMNKTPFLDLCLLLLTRIYW